MDLSLLDGKCADIDGKYDGTDGKCAGTDGNAFTLHVQFTKINSFLIHTSRWRHQAEKPV